MTATLLMVAIGAALCVGPGNAATALKHDGGAVVRMKLIPYPREISVTGGTTTTIAAPEVVLLRGCGKIERIGRDQLRRLFSVKGSASPTSSKLSIVIGTFGASKDMVRWLGRERVEYLSKMDPQGYILLVERDRIVVGGSSPIGTLYGVQTLVQMLRARERRSTLPRMEIRDWPSIPNRYVAIQLAWYSGFGPSLGFGSQLWSEEQWRWYVDWCLEHKVNGIDLCMYGYWPFRFPEYPETTLTDVAVRTLDPKSGRITTARMSHPNIRREFLPGLIRYAQARGIKVNAYIGLNSYNGGYIQKHPEAHPFMPGHKDRNGYAALDLCIPAARQYLRASVRRIMRFGFDGVTFEMNEGSATVCAKPECVRKYWKGFEHLVTAESMPGLTPLRVRVRADADWLNDLCRVIVDENPSADVSLIYHCVTYRYGWSADVLECIKEFRNSIPSRVRFTQGPRAPRDGEIKGSELETWINIVDPQTYRHGDNMGGAPTVFFNNTPETRGVGTVDQFWLHPVDWAIVQHRAAARLGLGGATAYAFGWYGQQALPLILAQYAWAPDGPTGVADGRFFEYSCQHMYGDLVGSSVSRLQSLPAPGDPEYRGEKGMPASRGEAVRLAEQALKGYAGGVPEYRNALQHLLTASRIRAAAYETSELRTAAQRTDGEKRSGLLRAALDRAEEVRRLILTGEPRSMYLDVENSLMIGYSLLLAPAYTSCGSIVDLPAILEIRKQLGLPAQDLNEIRLLPTDRQ